MGKFFIIPKCKELDIYNIEEKRKTFGYRSVWEEIMSKGKN